MAQQTTTQDLAGTRAQGTTIAGNGAAPTRQVTQVPLGSIKKNDAVVKNPPLAAVATGSHPLEKFMDVPLTMIFEVGRTQIAIGQLMELNKGSMIDLWPLSVDVIDIRVNETVIAYGEVIALGQHYGIRFGELKLLDAYEDRDDAL